MPSKIAVLTEGYCDPITAKTAVSVIRYRPDEIVAVVDSAQAGKACQEVLGVGGRIPVVATIEQAPAADTLLVGIAPPGGRLPPAMRRAVLAAVERGMTVISGLHEFLCDDPEIANLAAQRGAVLHDVRKNSERDVAQRVGLDERCCRLHTVGHDCSVGKMVVAIEVARGLQGRGRDAKFVATGQTGIMIEGDGCPVDCVVADFVNGAAEKLVLANQQHEFLLIEGQGSLVHPRYSAVTLGLLHGTAPDGLILCYEVGRTRVNHMESIPLPPLAKVKEINEALANLMHPCRVIGIAMNSRGCTEEEAGREREGIRREFGLPVCDVLRHGPEELVDAAIRRQEEVGKRRCGSP